MRCVLMMAGLSVDVHDRVRAVSADRFVPNCRLIIKPISKYVRYSTAYARAFIDEAYSYAASLPEDEEVSLVLCYVNNSDDETVEFVQTFYPYCLPIPLQPIDHQGAANRNEWNRRTSLYLAYLQKESRRGRELALQVKRFTNVHNLTPLLLPIRNFKSNSLHEMLG